MVTPAQACDPSAAAFHALTMCTQSMLLAAQQQVPSSAGSGCLRMCCQVAWLPPSAIAKCRGAALSYWEARSTEHSRKQAAVTAKLVAEGPAEDCVQVVVPPGTPPGTDLTYSSPVLGDTSGDSTDDSQSYQAGSEGVAETMALMSNQPESSALLK
ncbi:hypothetical protein HaLaN_30969 [Haematococcus lacustris]|uniref:Uncharacterized protein n=1 Tax=Haematococcus lacustris TaxID=44745 RepID=A0A6A0AG04_HAELA|nr:hypothetical protein HaLaN_30969 [Haematococcus lacustris]